MPLSVGYTLWFTGLSGSGKSTLAFAVSEALIAQGVTSPEILDGDEIRATLSSELGFSPQDRMKNILRIGWVAQLLTRHHIPTLVACISPYRQARRQVRGMVEAVAGKGSFVEIFVDCPLDVCISRDPKGLYAKARVGMIQDLTGLNDSYEPPDDPEIHLQTESLSVEGAVDSVMLYLAAHHFIETKHCMH
jgi:adenylylsulfate kinase